MSKSRSLWLPQYAATYAPMKDLTVYGNYGVLLSLGPQAPWWVDNGSVFLEPFLTRQSEIGAKYERRDPADGRTFQDARSLSFIPG